MTEVENYKIVTYSKDSKLKENLELVKTLETLLDNCR